MNLIMKHVIVHLVDHRIQKNIRFHIIVNYIYWKYTNISWESYDEYKEDFFYKDCKWYEF